jgi:hypothetical protein
VTQIVGMVEEDLSLYFHGRPSLSERACDSSALIPDSTTVTDIQPSTSAVDKFNKLRAFYLEWASHQHFQQPAQI